MKNKKMKNKNELKTIMRTHKEQTKCMGLPIFLGYDDNNQPLIVDLAKVGNILVGGATGQGKTNLLHSFAQSIYYAPRKVFEGCIVYYIDSKGCEEFSPYFDIHLNTIEDINAHIDMMQERIGKLAARLRIEMPRRVAFRVATVIESRVIIDSPEATLLTNKGEILFSHNLKLTRLQTINVVDDNGE